MIKKGIKIFLVSLGIGALILVSLIIIGVVIQIGNITPEEEEPRVSIKYTSEGKPPGVDEDSITDSEYHETLQEALYNNGVKSKEGKEYEKTIDEIIKSWENDNYILIFFRAVKNKEEECLTMAKFKKKLIDEKEKYVFLTGIPTYHSRDAIYIGGSIENLVDSQLDFTDFMQNINIDNHQTRFIYGEVQFEEIKNLKIEGEKPTDIIQYKVCGEVWYLWYYEKFESDKAGNTLEITF